MNAGPAPVVSIADLAVGFGGRRVVDGVDLCVGDAEVLTLVGPSGCGKSTLVRSIAGLVQPESGRIVISGRDMTAVPPEQRRIGFVFQEAALFGHRRVADNVAFGLRHLSRPDRDRRVGEMLELVGLAGFGRRHPHELSGGEQQRVALARALAPNPRIVLLDEPFANLDEVLRETLGRDVAAILRTAGTASILVTHDRREAMALGDRVAVMRDGRIVQCDTPRTVYGRPTDRFVASFLDRASFLAAADGSTLVARPHQIGVVRGGADRVVRVEFLGARCRYEVRAADGAVVVAEGEGADPLATDEPCTIVVDRAALHRLD